MSNEPNNGRHKTGSRENAVFKTVWISDVHLGTRGSQASRLRKFLQQNPCDTLYLVGDIVDVWAMSRKPWWSPASTLALLEINKAARAGTRVVYFAGNHDELLRDFGDGIWQGVEFKDREIFVDKNGKRYLVIHGDQFDPYSHEHKFVAKITSAIYDQVIVANRRVNKLTSLVGLPYYSASAWLKTTAKQVAQASSSYQDLLADAAKEAGAEGVICGHIHRAERRDINGIDYINDGDWVECCTALVETLDGELKLVQFNPEGGELRELAGNERPDHIAI